VYDYSHLTDLALSLFYSGLEDWLGGEFQRWQGGGHQAIAVPKNRFLSIE
jgi:hypothetical protein